MYRKRIRQYVMLVIVAMTLIMSFGCSSDKKTEELRDNRNERLKRGYGKLPIDSGGIKLPKIKK